MINISETSPEDFDDWINWDEVAKKWQKEIDDYNNWDEEYKQNYWSIYILQQWWYDQRWTSLPVNIEKIRKEKEKEINKYIPKAIDELREEWYTWKIEYVITLDEQARKYLENIWYFLGEEIKSDVKDLLN